MPSVRQQPRRIKAKTLPLGDDVDVVEYVGHASLAIAAGVLPVPAEVRRRISASVALTASEREIVAGAAAHMQHICDTVDVKALNKMLTKLPTEIRAKADRMASEFRGYAMGGDVVCDGCDGGVKGGLACQCGRTWHAACALASLPRAYAHVVTSAALFPNDSRVIGFQCAGCKYASVPVATKNENVRQIMDRLESLGEKLHDFADAVASHPTRKSLPGSLSRAVGGSRFVFAEILAEAALRAEGGSAAADIVVAFAPRLFLRKRYTLNECVAQVLHMEIPDLPASTAPSLVRAGRALSTAVRESSTRYTLRVLDRVAGDQLCPSPPDASTVKLLFPEVNPVPNEENIIRRLRESFSEVPRTTFGDADLRRWASQHLCTAGGYAGWTGSILLDAFGIRKNLCGQMVKLWARPKSEWAYGTAARVLWRHCDGWLLPKPGGSGWRPIGAPQLPRRVAGAAATRACLPLIRRYCEERGQFGLSAEPAMLAYSYAATLHVMTGQEITTADRSKSFQTIERNAVVSALTDLVAVTSITERGMAAILLDAVLACWVDTDDFGVSNVDFGQVGVTVEARGLPQGCSISIVLQAVVLAWWAQKNGAYCALAHDDLWSPSQYKVPDCGEVGGEYNFAKGATSSSHGPLVIFGRPVNHFAAFAHDYWLPKFRRRCAALEAVATTDYAAAVEAMDKLGGPYSSAVYWLKTLPPSAFDDRHDGRTVEDALALAEKEWLRLVAIISDSAEELDRMRVFGSTNGLAHVPLISTARHWSAVGLAKGFAGAVALARRLLIDVSQWPRLLGLGVDLNRSTTGAALQAANHIVALREIQCALDARVPEAQTADARQINLWQAALRPPGRLPDLAGLSCVALGRTVDRATVVKVALRRVLGLPVWQAFGIRPICGAPCILCEGVRNSAGGSGVGAKLDGDGLHVTACVAVQGRFGNIARHDALAKAAAEIGRRVGMDSFYHDGPIFDHGAAAVEHRRYRPADWYCRDESKDFPMGVCHDITIRHEGGAALAAAESAKVRHYADFMKDARQVGFVPFAVSLGGGVGPAAFSTMQTWSTRLATTRRGAGEPLGQPRDDVLRSFARAFAAVVVAQQFAYVDLYVRSLGNGAGPGPAKRCSPVAGRRLRRLPLTIPPQQRGRQEVARGEILNKAMEVEHPPSSSDELDGGSGHRVAVEPMAGSACAAGGGRGRPLLSRAAEVRPAFCEMQDRAQQNNAPHSAAMVE
jgi:hypothetical protein